MTRAPRIAVDISGWTRFDSFNLTITPRLAGAEHQFRFGGRMVTIRLPKRPPVKDWQSKHGRISCSGWRVRNGRKVPLHFHVHQIDVLVDTNRKASIRAAALTRVTAENFTKGESQRFDRIAESARESLSAGFDYWVSILRWKSGFASACQFTHARQRTGWGTYLRDKTSSRAFYSPRLVFTVQRERVINSTTWRAVGRAVAAGVLVPVWRQHYLEAHQKLRIGDTRGYILDLAIASETMIRQLMTRLLRDDASAGLKRLLGSLALGRVLDDWTKIGFSSTKWKQSKESRDDVKKIIDLRNTIMHRGEAPNLEHKTLSALAGGVNHFLMLGERELSRRTRQ